MFAWTVRVLLVVFGVFFAGDGFSDQSRSDVVKQFTAEEIVAMGKNIYHTPGENTCLKCHRDGQGEGWAGAADLRKPWKWNSVSGLGGYEALEKDPDAFYKQLYTVLEYLLEEGGLKWNLNFKKDHPDIRIDWSKTALKKTQYDMMMWGVVQPAMKQKIKLVQTQLAAKGIKLTDTEMRDLAVYSLIEYIKGFEEPHLKDDGTAYPKIHRPGQEGVKS